MKVPSWFDSLLHLSFFFAHIPRRYSTEASPSNAIIEPSIPDLHPISKQRESEHDGPKRNRVAGSPCTIEQHSRRIAEWKESPSERQVSTVHVGQALADGEIRGEMGCWRSLASAFPTHLTHSLSNFTKTRSSKSQVTFDKISVSDRQCSIDILPIAFAMQQQNSTYALRVCTTAFSARKTSCAPPFQNSPLQLLS